jgi:hypothetical protein
MKVENSVAHKWLPWLIAVRKVSWREWVFKELIYKTAHLTLQPQLKESESRENAEYWESYWWPSYLASESSYVSVPKMGNTALDLYCSKWATVCNVAFCLPESLWGGISHGRVSVLEPTARATVSWEARLVFIMLSTSLCLKEAVASGIILVMAYKGSSLLFKPQEQGLLWHPLHDTVYSTWEQHVGRIRERRHSEHSAGFGARQNWAGAGAMPFTLWMIFYK